jgi:colanic acid/amylovoran biosynthesis glycosyltransferase
MTKVLHLFDKYLNSTMNWAAGLLQEATAVKHQIASPWIVRNEYHYAEFEYHYSVLQSHYGSRIRSEFEGGLWEKIARSIENRSGWWLSRARNYDFDLIHAHFGPVGCQAIDIARASKKPLIVSFYGYDYQKALIVRPELRAKYTEMFEVAQVCIALGPETSKMLQALGCPAAKIEIVPLALHTRSIPFEANKQRAMPLRLLQVASFSEKKGIPDTIEAFARALGQVPDMHLTLVGEIVEQGIYAKVLAMIEQDGLTNRVDVKGFMRNEKIKQLLPRFDVFIHPSHQSAQGDTEGLPVAILEALASGMPVISTYHADIPSAVQHGINGTLCAPRQIDALSEAIVYYATMPDPAFEAMRKAARQTITDHFDLPIVARRLEQVYARLGKN